jgi:hypothetical protein
MSGIYPQRKATPPVAARPAIFAPLGLDSLWSNTPFNDDDSAYVAPVSSRVAVSNSAPAASSKSIAAVISARLSSINPGRRLSRFITKG